MSKDDIIKPVENSLPEHLKESVSALFDGELSHSEGAFLVKRLSHDAELRSQWQSYQCIGEVLRGNSAALNADAFSARILAKIAEEKSTTSTSLKSAHTGQSENSARRGRWLKTSLGLGIAASVAWTALMLTNSGVNIGSSKAEFAEATPITVASPVVSMHTVSGRIGSSYAEANNANNALLMQSMETFLLQHATRTPASPLSPVVYLQDVTPQ